MNEHQKLAIQALEHARGDYPQALPIFSRLPSGQMKMAYDGQGRSYADVLQQAKEKFDKANAAIAWVAAQKPKTAKRVLCAAIRADDGTFVVSMRHYDEGMLDSVAKRPDKGKFYHRGGRDQGFVDSSWQYLTREEAYIVAMDAGQVLTERACCDGPNGRQLFSEALY